MNDASSGVSNATLRRMPAYIRFLRARVKSGAEYVSSAEIARELDLSPVTVRKDLALVSTFPGKPKLGFPAEGLIADLERFLGYRRRTNAVVVGAGGLGRAIMRYEGFEHYGLSVVAGFDISPEMIGAVGGKPIYPMERLDEIVRREDVKLGILTVPRSSAQSAFDHMIRAGIRAVYSFAPIHLDVPAGVHVKYEDLAASLAAFSSGLLLSQ